ncbi:MAG: TonB-dependent receptor [Acidobacteriota bacterium]
MSRLWCGFVVFVLILSGVSSASAQSTASISGVVRDSGGGVVPGATVVVKEDATGRTHEVVTGADGSYQVRALLAGSYTVTASLTGFKTAEAKGIRVAPGQPVTIPLTLEIGELTETVTVTSSAELINTETATVAATLNADQLNRMPTPTRNALNAITFLPGVNTATTNRNSSINGLPDSFLSITLDGVGNNDNFLRSSDGFFASVYPRQDAVEAASVTLAAAGAQVGGGAGAVTMAFQTRSGGNRFSGSTYEYYRNPKLNTNYYFNTINDLEKNDVKLHQYGARAGGPIRIPGLYDGRNKAFFFVHYEQLRFPNSFTRTRNVLHERALDGWFRYQFGSTVREVNVLQLAAANGQISAKDPTVFKLLQQIEAAMLTTGTRSASADPLYDNYTWLSPGELFEHQPTIRLDYNLGSRHRLSGSFSAITATRDPDYLNSADSRFPGAPNFRIFTSTRPIFSTSLRSTFGTNIVNELRGGGNAFYGYSRFGKPESNGPQTFEDSDGYAIDFDSNIGLTNWYLQTTPSWRKAPGYSIEDTVTWQRGKHSLSFGGSYLLNLAEENAQQQVNFIQLGFNQQFDPARGLFTTANFPGASSAQLNDARDLYALLTGRVSSVQGQAALDAKTNEYVSLGPRSRQGKISVFGVFWQDSWKVTPTLTLTGGLRWDVQTPFSPSNDIMSSVTLESVCGISGLGDGSLYNKCNFLSPGASGGVVPEFIQLKRGTEGYTIDWNNLAPSASVAWRPNVQTGFLRTLLGDPEQATLRGGWSVAYERQGMSIFTGVFGNNPGSTLTLNRDVNTGLVPAGESWPVLFSQKDRLYIPSFPTTATFPIALRENRADSIYAFAPDIEIAQAQTWMVGFQRSITRDMAMEIRYVGTRGSNQWSQLNWNAIRGENILANGFLDEFRLAMANLVANNTAGGTRAGSFAYFGPGTGTSPLPIYLAYLNGRSDFTNPAAYTGGSSTWSSSTLAGRLSPANPAPTTSAGDLDGNTARRANAAALGYPANFFVPNPAANQVNVYDSGAFSDYHALQVELRRRLSKGLSANVNYQYALEGGSAFDGFSYGRTMIATANVRHAIKMQWDWQVPVGRDHRFGRDLHPVLNAIVGGWSINGVGRVQARVLDMGAVRLVGMTKDELQAMYKYYKVPNATTGRTEVWMLPADVILNTRRAYSVSNATVNGYSTSLGPPEGRYIAPANSGGCIQIRGGDCGIPRTLMLRAPWFARFDLGATKRFDVRGPMNIEVRVDVLNVFDAVNFTPVANPGSGATIFQVTSGYTDPSNTYDPGGRLGQIMIRFNW